MLIGLRACKHHACTLYMTPKLRTELTNGKCADLLVDGPGF